MIKVPLKDICLVFGDGDWIESKDQSDSGIRLIQTGNVGSGVFKERIEKARWISEETFMKLRCTEVGEGDVLISRLPDPVGRACLLPNLAHRAITAVDCSILRFDPKKMQPEYFVYYSQSTEYDAAIRPLISGSTRQRISREKLGTVTVPFLPLEKQREIVQKLDKAFASIDKLCLGMGLHLNLVQDLFKEICREKTQRLGPSSFKSLKEVASVITKGTTPTSLGHKFSNEGVNFLKVESLDAVGGFIKTKFAYIDLDCQNVLKRSQLKEFDVLVSIAGALGRTAIVTEDICPANINQALSLIRLPENSDITPNFLFSLFQAGYFNDDLDRMGAGAAQQNLSLAQIGSLRVPIFSKAKQEEFINFLFELRNQVTQLIDQLEKKILLTRNLQDSILYSIFNTMDLREKTA